jgi:hypothetical protein
MNKEVNEENDEIENEENDEIENEEKETENEENEEYIFVNVFDNCWDGYLTMNTMIVEKVI